jgi:hypothetical protein
MKITTISKVANLVISSVMIQTAVAGHEVGIGVGPHFTGGGFGGVGFHSAPAFGNPSPHPTVTAVQPDLTKLGYYHGSIDGLYGRATRGAVARYQTGHHMAVTGTLTIQMLQLLGISPTGRAEISLVRRS